MMSADRSSHNHHFIPSFPPEADPPSEEKRRGGRLRDAEYESKRDDDRRAEFK